MLRRGKSPTLLRQAQDGLNLPEGEGVCFQFGIKFSLRPLRKLCALCGFFSISFFNAQSVCDTSWYKYPFIVTDSNKIYNDSIFLNTFFEKLFKGKDSVIRIVHIGDSHIQADHFSGKIRQNLQLDFGNAGRGLVFPYRLAKTNEPVSFKTSTTGIWQGKRNVFPDSSFPIGVSGITIETADTSADIKLVVKDQSGLNYSFNKLSLFHSKSEEYFDFVVMDSLQHEIGYVNTLSQNKNKFVSDLKFDTLRKQVIIKPCPRNTNQTCAQIYGILLENGKPGILYNMIGVNGAEYRHYNQSIYFIDQLSVLQPDLVIISLGTNEGYNAGFDAEKFYANIDTLVKNIKNTNPKATFLLTTPGDSFKRTRKGRVKNPNILAARNTIILYCKNNNLPYWDLFSIMGGYGSMLKWYKVGLSAKDRLHFSAKGYTIQADMFYSALMECYKKRMK